MCIVKFNKEKPANADVKTSVLEKNYYKIERLYFVARFRFSFQLLLTSQKGRFLKILISIKSIINKK